VTTPSPRRDAVDGDAHESDEASLHSVHGGRLQVDDRVLRAQVAQQLFGKKPVVSIGRFRVKRLIGAGGMGQVFEADDPQLDRAVAVKVLRRLGEVDRERARTRMEREAKAQARIKDPHVVTVHEVGPFEDGLYIAMELVDGPNLRQWLAQRDRPWREVLGKFMQAGQGLAAAHRRGLVHRDFKPDNVLIDREDERARVADFGLVQVGASHADEASTPGDAAPELTVGAGTPEYMSPEQRAGEIVDARSDQFSFCVALRQALVKCDAPPKVLRAADRGLAERPADRYPDMPALLAALQRASASRRPLAFGAAAIGATAIVLAIAWPRARDCEAEADLGDTWGDAERTAATASAEAATLKYIAGAWPATQQALDDYADRWRAQNVRACELADTRTEELALRSRDCLDTLRDDLGFVTAALARGDEQVLASALQLASTLPEPQVCNDEPRLQRWTRPTDAPTLTRRDEVRTALRTAAMALAAAQSRSTGDAWEGHLEQGAEAAEQARAGALELDDAGLEARALHLLGELALHGGRNDFAEAQLQQAAARAEAAGDDRLRVRALSLRVYVIGAESKRLREALQVAAQAEAVLAKLDDPALLRARLLTHVGTAKAKDTAATRDEGIRDLRQAIDLLTEALGEGHPEVLSVRVNLGNTLARAGQSEASRDELLAAATAAPGVWGPDHPFTARVEGMLGMALLRTGDLAGARRNLESALRKAEAALGPDHIEVGDAHYNLAMLLQRTDEHREAVEHLEVGLAQRERDQGADVRGNIAWLYALGKSQFELGELQGAEARFRRALALSEHFGGTWDDYARIRFLLARAVVDRDPDEARFLARHAATMYREHDDAERLAKVEAFLRAIPP
jgi:tetratricopeptide (TPR) repeat protein